MGTLGLNGVIAMEMRAALVTVSVVVPGTFVAGSRALIVVVPAETDVARPRDPFALLMAATDISEELQVTDAVTSCVELSVYVPVAVNCFERPSAMFGLPGVTVMDLRAALVMVSVVVPDRLVPGSRALMVVVPTAVDVAIPCEPLALLIVATEVVDELQRTEEVRFCVELSE